MLNELFSLRVPWAGMAPYQITLAVAVNRERPQVTLRSRRCPPASTIPRLTPACLLVLLLLCNPDCHALPSWCAGPCCRVLAGLCGASTNHARSDGET